MVETDLLGFGNKNSCILVLYLIPEILNKKEKKEVKGQSLVYIPLS